MRIESGEWHECSDDPGTILRIANAQINNNIRFLSVTLPCENFLNVNFNWRGAIAICHQETEPRGVYDASTDPVLSGERIRYYVDDTNFAPIDRSMLLGKRAVRKVIEDFVMKGEKSDAVYWIQEGPAP